MLTTIRQQFTVSYDFPVVFTRDVFGLQNLDLLEIFSGCEPKPNRLLVVIDSGVAQASPGITDAIAAYVSHHGDVLELAAHPYIMRGGEACKQDATEFHQLHSLLEKNHLCRHSFVVAIGGGAVLDVVGYAAATAHRGVRLIRLPTTTLAQNDAGVGVKNGINAYGKKNFLGTFAPPFAVINDFNFLATLPERESRAGIAEAVKVAIIKDRQFFDFLHRRRKQLAIFARDSMEQMVERCARLHIEHIGANGDPFELGSARPLDFGHWLAHKLEEMTAGDVRHGEAVAIGMALDSLYARHTGLITRQQLAKIFATLADIGFALYHPAIGQMDFTRALLDFREHLGGELTITLPHGIGDRVEIHNMDTDLLRRCADMLASRSTN